MGCNASIVQQDGWNSLDPSDRERILNKQRVSIENKIQAELAIAKANREEKKVALGALRRKKCLEKELSEVSSALLQLEMRQMMQEGASNNVQTRNILNVDGFSKEINAQQYNDELWEATSEADDAEMAELMEELNELSEEETEEKQNDSKEQEEENLPAAVDETETTDKRTPEEQENTKTLGIQAVNS